MQLTELRVNNRCINKKYADRLVTSTPYARPGSANTTKTCERAMVNAR